MMGRSRAREEFRSGEVPRRQEIESEIETILSSPAFKDSSKSKEFLRFVVQRYLDGESSGLHERLIGIELLGKNPDYDPSEDASVRVRANEVRKRLATFYEAAGNPARLRVDLPAGGYVPQFRRTSITPAAPEPPRAKSRRWRIWGIAAVVVLGLATFLVFRMQPANTALDNFWRPVYAHQDPVVLCLPGLRALAPRGGTEGWKLLSTAPPFFASAEELLAHGDKKDWYLEDDMVGMGALFGAVRVTTFLTKKGKSVVARLTEDTSFSDLRAHPAILLGGFTSNRWTREMNQDTPFLFEMKGDTIQIVETRPPNRSWSPAHCQNIKRCDEDFATVSRLIDSTSGQIIVTAAGITTFGTQAAAECLVDSDCVAKLVAAAPHDWPFKNVEGIIHTKVLGNTPGPAQLVAIRFW